MHLYPEIKSRKLKIQFFFRDIDIVYVYLCTLCMFIFRVAKYTSVHYLSQKKLLVVKTDLYSFLKFKN